MKYFLILRQSSKLFYLNWIMLFGYVSLKYFELCKIVYNFIEKIGKKLKFSLNWSYLWLSNLFSNKNILVNLMYHDITSLLNMIYPSVQLSLTHQSWMAIEHCWTVSHQCYFLQPILGLSIGLFLSTTPHGLKGVHADILQKMLVLGTCEESICFISFLFPSGGVFSILLHARLGSIHLIFTKAFQWNALGWLTPRWTCSLHLVSLVVTLWGKVYFCPYSSSSAPGVSTSAIASVSTMAM